MLLSNILSAVAFIAIANARLLHSSRKTQQVSMKETNPDTCGRPQRPNRNHDNAPFTLSGSSTIHDYFDNNKYYVDSIKHDYQDEVFKLNAKAHTPHTLWIGCVDARSGEGSLAALPGEILTMRNIANIVNSHDLSTESALQFAVDVLKVKKIIVAGHTDCGGAWASLSNRSVGGVVDSWLNPIRQIRAANTELLDTLKDNPLEQSNKLVELNVIRSVQNVRRHLSVSNALKRGDVEVWGMLYHVDTGLLSQVEVPNDQFAELFQLSVCERKENMMSSPMNEDLDNGMDGMGGSNYTVGDGMNDTMSNGM